MQTYESRKKKNSLRWNVCAIVRQNISSAVTGEAASPECSTDHPGIPACPVALPPGAPRCSSGATAAAERSCKYPNSQQLNCHLENDSLVNFVCTVRRSVAAGTAAELAPSAAAPLSAVTAGRATNLPRCSAASHYSCNN